MEVKSKVHSTEHPNIFPNCCSCLKTFFGNLGQGGMSGGMSGGGGGGGKYGGGK